MMKIVAFLLLFTFVNGIVGDEATASEPAAEVKPTETTEQKSEEVEKAVEEAVKPTEETVKSADEAAQPTEETVKSADEAAQPTEEPIKPAEEAAKPLEETTKPAEEAAKPLEETTKPAEEAAKPVEETTKPAKEAAKSVEETTKPAEEAANSVEETAQPKEEAAKTEEDSSKLAEEDDSMPDFKFPGNVTDDEEFSNDTDDLLMRMFEDYMSGKVDKAEIDKRFQEYRAKLQQDITDSVKASKNEIWENMGKKENDTVTWEEYQNLAFSADSIPPGQKVEDLSASDKEKFEAQDIDKDGKLTFQEFQTFITSVLESKMPEYNFEKMMQDLMGNDTDFLKDAQEDAGGELDESEKDDKSEDDEDSKDDDKKEPESAEAKKDDTKAETPSPATQEPTGKHEEL